MRVRVRLVRPFRDAVGHREVQLEPLDPGLLAALGELADRHPALRVQLFEGGALSPLVNVYVNGRAVPAAEAAARELRDGDEVLFLLAMTGG